jgi:hypothetical protein
VGLGIGSLAATDGGGDDDTILGVAGNTALNSLGHGDDRSWNGARVGSQLSWEGGHNNDAILGVGSNTAIDGANDGRESSVTS